MINATNTFVIDLLSKINSNQIETFFNFPNVIRSGNIHLDRTEIDYLFLSGYLEQKRVDTFGTIFQLNEKARSILMQLGMLSSQNASS